MEIADIQIHEPTTIKEACGLLNEYCDSARVMMGGTDLIVDLKQDRVTGIEHLIMLHRIDGLREIKWHEEGNIIGALVTPNQVIKNTHIASNYSALCHAVRTMAAYQVRSMATICGNIASAVPSSDLAPFFVAMDSKVILSNGESERTVKVREYFLGPRKTVCGEAEILTHLILPHPETYSGSSYQKFALRGGNALAVASVAASLILHEAEITDACVVLGAVAPIPLIATKTNEFLKGKRPSEVNFAEAGLIAMQEARPITDIRGTIEYRRELVKVLTKRALSEAFSEARDRIRD